MAIYYPKPGAREFKPGDVALVTTAAGPQRALYTGIQGDQWISESGWVSADFVLEARPLVVIDPEDREQVERLASAYSDAHLLATGRERTLATPSLQAALREYADPTPPKPDEPTDPAAVVTDHRENTWRLLADGDWVCTYGPDHGEYLNWARLTDRGPLEIEVPR